MNAEISTTPWAYDELQLMGAELGDTIHFISQDSISCYGVIIFLNKITIYTITEKNEIIKFNRSSLVSFDHKWEILGLAEKQIRISANTWKKAKEKIVLEQVKKDKK